MIQLGFGKMSSGDCINSKLWGDKDVKGSFCQDYGKTLYIIQEGVSEKWVDSRHIVKKE